MNVFLTLTWGKTNPSTKTLDETAYLLKYAFVYQSLRDKRFLTHIIGKIELVALMEISNHGYVCVKNLVALSYTSYEF